MATVNVSVSYVNDGVVNRPRSTAVWEGIATGDTIGSLTVAGQSAVASAVQISGTFGGATVAMECSNDGVTWFTMIDSVGDPISATADAFHEISSSALYIRPAISGGTGDDIDVILVLRG